MAKTAEYFIIKAFTEGLPSYREYTLWIGIVLMTIRITILIITQFLHMWENLNFLGLLFAAVPVLVSVMHVIKF
jgi:hypothetical protein